jgi:acyl carrier protein
MSTTRDRLKSVFLAALELQPNVEVESLDRAERDEWDSLHHMTLVVAIEDEFGVELSTAQVLRIETFEAAVTTLSELGVPA